jgi:hypothetical protein
MAEEGKIGNKALAKIAEALHNTLEIGSDAAIKQFAPAEELDTGGIEPDAYIAELYADYEEAIGTMGLPPDDETYRRYGYNRYWKLFEIRRDDFGEFVVSEKRDPPRLTPAENIDTVAQTLRDMELLKTAKVVLRPNGKLVPFTAPNAEVGGPPNASPFGEPRSAGIVRDAGALGTYRGAAPILDPTAVPFGPPPYSELYSPGPMLPSDSLPRGSRTSEDRSRPAQPRDASASTPSFTTSYVMMRMRPGETRTQKIEVPGVTLNLTVSVS